MFGSLDRNRRAENEERRRRELRERAHGDKAGRSGSASTSPETSDGGSDTCARVSSPTEDGSSTSSGDGRVLL